MSRANIKLSGRMSWGKRASAFIGVFVLLLQYMVLFAPAPSARATTALTRLEVSGDNYRYFEDQSGNIVYLTGAHNWANLVDNGDGNPPPAFDYDAYLDFLESHDMNFVRLWAQEQARWTGEVPEDDYWNGLNPYNRVSGHGSANDGEDKFDLTSLNQDYFDHLRERVEDAGERNMYVSVMLFNGWSTECKGSGGTSCGLNKNPWDGHPYNAANNINSMDGDTDNDGFGKELHEYDAMDANSMDIWDFEEDYIKKVVDTVGDLPNVLYEICNECNGNTLDRDWHYEVIDLIHTYENTQFSVNHPVGYSMNFPGPNTSWLNNSDAEWVSQGGSMSNPTANNSGKVMIQDTDHLCGVCLDNEWAWKATTRGQQTLFMDRYDGASYGNDAGFTTNTLALSNWNNVRDGMGDARLWAQQVDLKNAVPDNGKATSGFALVNDGTTNVDDYLVYSEDGDTSVDVDLTNTAGNVTVQWYDVDTNTITGGSPVAGGATRTFTKPSSSTHGMALLLKEADTVNPTATVTAPSASATVSGTTVTLTATASDNRAVAGVQFKVDGNNVGSEDTSSPYSISWDSTSVGNGSHTITAVARDTSSNTGTSSGVSITTNNGDTVNPTVSLTAPANSATVSGNSVAISATASDDVAVAGVQFKVDGNNVGSEDTSSPYTVNWDTTTATEGSHTITAVARDTSNNTATSSSRTVTVDNYVDLVAAYGFNNSGSPRADNSGNGYTLDCGSPCPSYTSGGGHSSTGAYDFSSTSSDWLEIPSESPFDFTTNMTVEYWFQTPASGYDWGSTWAVIVAKGDSAWSTGRYGAYDSANFTTYNGSFWHDARSDNYNTTDDLNDGSWHHVAFTYDGTYKKMYIDGSLASTYNYTSTINNNSYKVSFGKDLEWGGGQFNGILDDVRIYSRALNSTEITNDMNTAVN